MNLRQIIKCYLSIVVALLFAPQPKVLGQQLNSPGCQAPLYSLSAVINNIPTLEGKEIVDIDVQQVTTEQELLSGKPPYKQNAVRNISSFWQMRVKNDDLSSLSGDKVKYQIVPDNIPGNPFKNVNAIPISGIKQYSSCSTDGTVVIEGGLSLEFRELSLLLGGNYGAQITVCVPVNGIQC
jgi:hypothetical protein